MFLDGRLQFRLGPGVKNVLRIPWDGEHVVEMKSPCCFPTRVPVGPKHPLPPDGLLARQLKPRPATLLVSPPAPAESQNGAANGAASGGLIVSQSIGFGVADEKNDLKWAGQFGRPVNIPFAGVDGYRRRVTVLVPARVAASGEKTTVSKPLWISAGGEYNVTLDLGLSPDAQDSGTPPVSGGPKN